MTNLDELERLYNAATPGPWRVLGTQGVAIWVADEILVGGNRLNHRDSRANTEFIVALVNAFPALLAELRALRELEAALDQCESNRGRFSCSPQHDARCQKDRKFGDCTCGSDRLNAALQSLDRAREVK